MKQLRFGVAIWLLITCCFNNSLKAQIDNYLVGTGIDGALNINASNIVINNYAQVTATAAAGNTSLVVNSTTNFAAGKLIMVLQSTGISTIPASGTQTSIDLTNNAVGRWELVRIASLTANTLTLVSPLRYGYAANVTQVITVPEYTTVTINSTRSIIAGAWNGSTGGVLAFLCQGTVTNNGTISAASRGFRGGLAIVDVSGSSGCTGLDEAAASGGQKGEGIANTRYGATYTGRGNIANGAGGGVCLNSGGGGGGNGGSGGRGGNSDDGNRVVGGLGGAATTGSSIDYFSFGGGGGAGHVSASSGANGGAGGGIIFIRCNSFSGGTLTASGGLGSSTATADGAGGGGAGGTIHIRCVGTFSATNIQAAGGMGGSANSGSTTGPGGGGGGGRIVIQANGYAGSPNVNGGSAGTSIATSDSYGAIAGSLGSATTNANAMSAPAIPTISTPTNNATVNTATPTISGTGTANSSIEIFVDNLLNGTATTDGAGNYSYVTTALSSGAHTVKASTRILGLNSDFTATNNFTVGPLPVTWVSFTAQPKNGKVELAWQTTNEINNDYFNIQNSSNGNDWNTIGTVAAKNNSSLNQYAFTHAFPIHGRNYYRLQQVDKDGKSTLSSVKLIDLSQKIHPLSIYPNPVKGNIVVIDLGYAITTPIKYILSDVAGKIIQTGSISTQQTTIQIANSSAGIYTLKLTDGRTVKLTKW